MKVVYKEKNWDIPEIPQYQHIRYARSLCCDCEYADYSRTNSFKIIGYTDTPNGLMIVCECPKCSDIYRHHIGSDGRYNLEDFKERLALKLHLQTRK